MRMARSAWGRSTKDDSSRFRSRPGSFAPVPDWPFGKYHVGMVNQPSDEPSFPRLRPSVSHKASLQAEIIRVRRMTVEERVKAALGLGRRFAWLQPAPARRDQ